MTGTITLARLVLRGRGAANEARKEMTMRTSSISPSFSLSVVLFSAATAAMGCAETQKPEAMTVNSSTTTAAQSPAPVSAAYPTDDSNASNRPTTSEYGNAASATAGETNNAYRAPAAAKTTARAEEAPPPAIAAPAAPVVANNPGAHDGTKAADNTKANDRDRHGTVTPMNQGNSAAETKITAAIRRAVVAEKGLSFNAKNVKIITTGSKVTLRGPVANDQEKSTIEARAKETPGVTDIDNQIEVKK